MRIGYDELQARIDDTAERVIQSAFPRHWNENHITETILTDLLAGDSTYLEIQGLKRPMVIAWDAYKQWGAAETDRGDIAVLVRSSLWMGKLTEGVGYLEAKRRYFQDGRYTALKSTQLRRIQKHAPLSQVLLYDYSPTTEFGDNLAIHGRLELPYYYRYHRPAAHAVSIPIGSVLASDSKDAALAGLGVPLSTQLCARFFRGFDLDYTEKAVRATRQSLQKLDQVRVAIPGPAFVLAVGIAARADELPDLGLDVNSDAYGSLALRVR